jgi:hypothetical protein
MSKNHALIGNSERARSQNVYYIHSFLNNPKDAPEDSDIIHGMVYQISNLESYEDKTE